MFPDRKTTERRTRGEGLRCNFARYLGGIRGMVFLAALAVGQVAWAEPVPLVFDTFSPATNIANMYNELGPGYTGGLTMRFLHVATCEGTTIDALVTAVVQPHTEFATGTTNRTGRGFIPNYKATAVGQPKGDLGLLYDGVDENISGITLTVAFFDGTGDHSGQFSTAYAIPDLQLLVYDVDGEPTQAEWVDAFYADGLSSYATGAAPTSVTATPSATGVHFLGCGKDLPETDTSGAVLLRYRNTSSITLAFGAEQYRDGKNAVFSAIHGGVGLPMTGSFEEPKAVPEPGVVSPARPEEPAPASKPDLRSASALYPGENVIRLDRVMPAKVPLNVPFDYTLKVTNLTDTAVQDVVVTEHRPENFKLQSADPQPDKKNGTFSWVLGTLEAKASREIKISGVATTADTLIPCATVTFVVPISVYGNVAVVEPKLVLTATVPKEVLLCDAIPAQVVVTNPGTGDLEEVKIVETLPAGLTTMEGGSELVLRSRHAGAGAIEAVCQQLQGLQDRRVYLQGRGHRSGRPEGRGHRHDYRAPAGAGTDEDRARPTIPRSAGHL